MKIALLLGSGISFPSGLPNSNEITECILNEHWHNDTGGLFWKGQNHNEYYERTNWVKFRIQPFLKIIMGVSDEYIFRRRSMRPNYEDLYYVVNQILFEEKGLQDNPALRCFIVKVKIECRRQGLFKRFDNGYSDLSILCQKSLDLIQCVLWNKLYKADRPVGMELISELCKSDLIDKVDVFTLNHDTLVENLLAIDNVPFIDGFGNIDGDVRKFKPELYAGGKSKVRIIKLHGSIDWYLFERNNTVFYGCSDSPDVDHCKDNSGQRLHLYERKPLFLTGTGNKLSNYAFGIYFDLQYWFRKLLNQHKIIVSSGYGWNDEGINSILQNWLLGKGKRLILLHEKESANEIQMKSKFGIGYRYGRMVQNGKIKCTDKYLYDVTLDELLALARLPLPCEPPNEGTAPDEDIIDFCLNRKADKSNQQ